jgi:pantothenate kinase
MQRTNLYFRPIFSENSSKRKTCQCTVSTRNKEKAVEYLKKLKDETERKEYKKILDHKLKDDGMERNTEEE